MLSQSAPSQPEKPLLLIVDDDPLICDTLSFSMSPLFEVVTSHSRSHCLQLLRQLRRPPELALVDLGLPPVPHRPDEGFALISDLLKVAPEIRIVVLSGQSDDGNARHARTLGAADFVAKPCSPVDLQQVLQGALTFRALDERQKDNASPLIGNSPAIQKLRLQLRQYADLPFPVLIEGESGSGKEIIASSCLHHETRRRYRPFMALNCAAISPNLIEATLFGYARGAFTGAVTTKGGYFEDAADGTLFLDEIGELALDLQAKLLRVLENGEYQRVGETQKRVSQARIIAATNRDLRKEVRAGHFRSDLYHRLSVCSVVAPPLREMGDDKLLLLGHFRMLYAAQTQQPPFTLAADAERLWLAYPFPGNVRELRNIVIRLTTRYPGQLVEAPALASELDVPDDPPAPAVGEIVSGDEIVAAAMLRLRQREPFSLDRLLDATERGYIEAALKLSHGNVSQAARLLGMHRTTLYNRMEAVAREP
ncbi:sigma-54 dependent transcriptional regulator [Accumulibacter sp.]|uniref:sigma-54-dependent transcriptional regulator n=1 Tax=Accumulibacter sp. TaxID=2053492 RepID=UPI0025F68080|nr:sigma-54 dependent transcriptional regulator [Accumulibacter sp.]MCM8594712.1 sigma-54 dependent transcriptional regulator [Accumulibacter sp.]MCM8625872.1 sigma-54 dependent transcriptional regulator [Accumulibacter sp.]MDS4048858.1 sigma-54 dependent transcriptional regulator [Accumulibacter sp.]